MDNKLIEAFDAFMRQQAKRVERFDNDNAIIYNIYKSLFKNDTDDEQKLLNITEEFVELDIIVHIPAMILTEDGTYYPGEDNYDPNIEFFSVMISK